MAMNQLGQKSGNNDEKEDRKRGKRSKGGQMIGGRQPLTGPE